MLIEVYNRAAIMGSLRGRIPQSTVRYMLSRLQALVTWGYIKCISGLDKGSIDCIEVCCRDVKGVGLVIRVYILLWSP